MATAGRALLNDSGRRGLLSSGRVAVFNQQGRCDPCCGEPTPPQGFWEYDTYGAVEVIINTPTRLVFVVRAGGIGMCGGDGLHLGGFIVFLSSGTPFHVRSTMRPLQLVKGPETGSGDAGLCEHRLSGLVGRARGERSGDSEDCYHECCTCDYGGIVWLEDNAVLTGLLSTSSFIDGGVISGGAVCAPGIGSVGVSSARYTIERI